MLYLLLVELFFNIRNVSNLIEQQYLNYLAVINTNLTVLYYQQLFSIGGLPVPEEAHLYWKNLANAIFFSFTLVSTIGYGNTVPLTTEGKVFAIFYLIFGMQIQVLMLLVLFHLGLLDGLYIC